MHSPVFSGQAATDFSQTTAINSHPPIQLGVRGLDGATTSVLQEGRRAKHISARQYKYANPLVNGWTIYFTLQPTSMMLFGAGWAITDMRTHISSEARKWQDLPKLGAFAIT